MKGSVGTSTHIVYIGPKKKKGKKKYLSHKTRFCVRCNGWINDGQWYKYSNNGKTYHHYKKECKK